MEKGFEEGHYALEYGPLLMAAVCIKEGSELVVPCDVHEVVSRLKPIAGKPLHFTLDGCDYLEFMPYYEVEGQSFSNFPEYRSTRPQSRLSVHPLRGDTRENSKRGDMPS